MRTPNKVTVACAAVMAGGILPPIIGLWSIPSSVEQALPGHWAMLWAVLTCVAWAGVAAGNLARLRWTAAWWPVILDMAAASLATISCLVYSVALAARFANPSSAWSIVPFVALAIWQGARAVQLWRDALRVAADD